MGGLGGRYCGMRIQHQFGGVKVGTVFLELSRFGLGTLA